MKNNSALFYTCSLIEFIGRERKLKRSELVQFFGKKVIERIYRYADVFHCCLLYTSWKSRTIIGKGCGPTTEPMQ